MSAIVHSFSIIEFINPTLYSYSYKLSPGPGYAHWLIALLYILVSTCGNSTACLVTKPGSLLLPLLYLASLLPPPPLLQHTPEY